MNSRVACWCIALLISSFTSDSQAVNLFASYGVYCNAENYTKQISHVGCSSEHVIVRACLGTCSSYSLPLPHRPYFKSVCHCCKASGLQERAFTLKKCDPGVTSPVFRIQSATTCSCSTCR